MSENKIGIELRSSTFSKSNSKISRSPSSRKENEISTKTGSKTSSLNDRKVVSKTSSQKEQKPANKPDIKKCCPANVCNPSDDAIKYGQDKARRRATLPEQPTYAPWVENYNRHLRLIEEMKPMIDCNEPLVVRENYVQIKPYNVRGRAFQSIEVRNAILLRRIADIYDRGSRIDNRLDPKHKSLDHRGLNRERKAVLLIHENYKINERMKLVKPHISRQDQLNWYSQQEKYMDNRAMYPLHFKPQPCSVMFKKIVEKTMENPKQYSYLQVECEDQTAANVICELFANLCPFTAKNFQTLCSNKKDDCKCRSYRCKKVDKLVSIPRSDGEYERAYWQIGSSVDAMPTFAQYILKESTNLKHTKAGYLTKPKGVASGEFYITLGPAPYLDDLCYIFGKVVGSGMSFLKKMEESNIDTQGNCKKPMHITDCGAVSAPNKVPKAMLMRDFINRVQEDIIPLLAEDYDDDDDGDSKPPPNFEKRKSVANAESFEKRKSVANLENLETRKSVANFETKKSVANVETRKSVANVETRKSVADFETRKSVANVETRKSVADFETRKSVENVETKKSVANLEARKSVANLEARKSVANLETRKSIYLEKRKSIANLENLETRKSTPTDTLE